MSEIAGSLVVLLAVCSPIWMLLSVAAVWFACQRSSQISRSRGE